METKQRVRSEDIRKKEKIPQYQQPESETKYYEREKYGVMYSEDYEWSAVECTKRAYGLKGGGRYLFFHTEFLEKEEAVKCIKQIPHYNGFDPVNVSALLKDLSKGTKISVGREHSVVLYIWTDQIEEITALFKRLENMAPVSAKAAWCTPPDEYHVCAAEVFPHHENQPLVDPEKYENGQKVLIRAWWD